MRNLIRWMRGRAHAPRPDASAEATSSPTLPHGMVDAAYCQRRYGDLPGGLEPLEHYLSVGHKPGFDPNPMFDSEHYARQVSGRDLGESGTLLGHYLLVGERDGLSPSPIFDPQVYLARNPDVAAAGVNALEHFIRWGAKEGRQFADPERPDMDARIDHVLSKDAENRFALSLRMARHILAGRLAEARSVAQQLPVEERARDLPPLLNSLAERCWVEGQLHQAVAAWEQSKSLAPATFESYGNFGLVLRALGHHLRALTELSAAVQHGDERPAIAEALRAMHAEYGEREFRVDAELGDSHADIQLFDTSFPSELSSFRFGEFSAYLRELPASQIHSSIWDISHLHKSESFSTMAARYTAVHGMDAGRVTLYSAGRKQGRVGYCVFLNNANLFFSEDPAIDLNAMAFTLYPGGGFELNDPNSDLKLRRLCDNPRLAKIITTQNLTYRYLIDKGFCEPDRLMHLFGGVVPMCFDGLGLDQIVNSRDVSRPVLNVCFVAQRYTAIGAEKGYDVFVALAARLCSREDIEFHVVGGFDASVIKLRPGVRIHFHGVQPASFFPAFYREMDIIVSPNISGYRLNGGQGSFDGFPTTCCVEAALCGTALFLSDFEGLNADLSGRPIYRPGVDFELIGSDADDLASRVLRYADDREALRALAAAGRAVVLHELGYGRQIVPRLQLLRDLSGTASRADSLS
ncbi:glycosyltransferase family protein [Cupriavidus oxalaticus]|uniref:glycosyltransferase family protein n=1 Tax=Cupriavidus oxalaticus TaxID=96344 RepID=UPI0040337FE8